MSWTDYKAPYEDAAEELEQIQEETHERSLALLFLVLELFRRRVAARALRARLNTEMGAMRFFNAFDRYAGQYQRALFHGVGLPEWERQRFQGGLIGSSRRAPTNAGGILGKGLRRALEAAEQAITSSRAALKEGLEAARERAKASAVALEKERKGKKKPPPPPDEEPPRKKRPPPDDDAPSSKKSAPPPADDAPSRKKSAPRPDGEAASQKKNSSASEESSARTGPKGGPPPPPPPLTPEEIEKALDELDAATGPATYAQRKAMLFGKRSMLGGKWPEEDDRHALEALKGTAMDLVGPNGREDGNKDVAALMLRGDDQRKTREGWTPNLNRYRLGVRLPLRGLYRGRVVTEAREAGIDHFMMVLPKGRHASTGGALRAHLYRVRSWEEWQDLQAKYAVSLNRRVSLEGVGFGFGDVSQWIPVPKLYMAEALAEAERRRERWLRLGDAHRARKAKRRAAA